MPKKLEDPAAGLHPIHTRVAMLSLAGMSKEAIALFLGSSSEAVGHILRLPKVIQYTTALRATMVSDVRRIARELNEKLEETAIESLDTQIEIMRIAKTEAIDPTIPERRWEAGRLAVASAQDILSRTMPKPQIGTSHEHKHSHLHVAVPAGLLEAVQSLNGANDVPANSIIDVSEPSATPDGMPLLNDDDEDEDGGSSEHPDT